MGLRAALTERLVAASTAAGDRVSWGNRARGDGLPALVLLMVSPGEEWTHDGPDGLNEPRIRVDCYARLDADADALAAEVKAEMAAAATGGGVVFHPASLEAERDLGDEDEAPGKPVYRVQLEFMFFYEETD